MAEQQTEMTREEFMRIEHEIQTGVRDTLPDGRKIADVQKELLELQQQQTADDLEKYGQKTETQTDFLQEKVNVVVSENGVISGISTGESVSSDDSSNSSTGSDLPQDFPGRKALNAAGLLKLEDVAKLDKEALTAISGIGDATAEAILVFGKE